MNITSEKRKGIRKKKTDPAHGLVVKATKPHKAD